ncbi:MAG: glycosyltransferase, partial [Bacteroidota bacterium]|nr:glycosyltransferase [Bacteroidota bacterium]
MKLSVITINFNNKAGLEKTIRSVIDQSFKDFEYILIDGGSTDGSAEVIRERAGEFAYWVSEKDNGIYNAMNKGILAAKGEYLLFLNSGDYLINSVILENISPELNGDPVIYGNGKTESSTGKCTNVEVPENPGLDFFSGNSLFHPSAFINRTLFGQYGLYNEANKIVSDWEFFIKTIMVNNVKARKIQFDISVIEENGISRNPESGAVLRFEIDRVLHAYFPLSVIALI